jgi:hypothetical protein
VDESRKSDEGYAGVRMNGASARKVFRKSGRWPQEAPIHVMLVSAVKDAVAPCRHSWRLKNDIWRI